MKHNLRALAVAIFLLSSLMSASARTWRDPAYGGIYEFGDDGVVKVIHHAQQFTGKWWSVSPSSVKFRFYDDKGNLRGVNSLEMRTDTTAVVHLADASRSFRWSLIEGRGPNTSEDSDDSGWFMEPLRF
jgi:hypothetical protein